MSRDEAIPTARPGCWTWIIAVAKLTYNPFLSTRELLPLGHFDGEASAPSEPLSESGEQTRTRYWHLKAWHRTACSTRGRMWVEFCRISVEERCTSIDSAFLDQYNPTSTSLVQQIRFCLAGRL